MLLGKQHISRFGQLRKVFAFIEFIFAWISTLLKRRLTKALSAIASTRCPLISSGIISSCGACFPGKKPIMVQPFVSLLMVMLNKFYSSLLLYLNKKESKALYVL